MQFGIKIVEVNGLHVLSSKTVFELESVNFIENGGRGLTLTTWYMGNMEKSLKEDPDFFSKFEALYMLFTEDDETYQCLHLLSTKFEIGQKHQVRFEFIVNSTPSDYMKGVTSYLIRKEEKRRERDRLEKLEDKLIEKIREAADRD